ncbi:hypothetical protein CLAIMM_08026 [Cladophialophora immunda]|nr:hypothetical protein CLAIMM_08026 [Cladophialophora immunda]
MTNGFSQLERASHLVASRGQPDVLLQPISPSPATPPEEFSTRDFRHRAASAHHASTVTTLLCSWFSLVSNIHRLPCHLSPYSMTPVLSIFPLVVSPSVLVPIVTCKFAPPRFAVNGRPVSTLADTFQLTARCEQVLGFYRVMAPEFTLSVPVTAPCLRLDWGSSRQLLLVVRIENFLSQVVRDLYIITWSPGPPRDGILISHPKLPITTDRSRIVIDRAENTSNQPPTTTTRTTDLPLSPDSSTESNRIHSWL